MSINYIAIILAAAKKAKVSGSILLALCTHESGLKNVFVPHDGGSPTYGICQVKYGTAQMLGFDGAPEDLLKPHINANFAAKYLKYQLDRYDGSYCKALSAYNAGQYTESKKLPGHPRNLKYVKKIQAKLDEETSMLLACTAERKDYAENNEP